MHGSRGLTSKRLYEMWTSPVVSESRAPIVLDLRSVASSLLLRFDSAFRIFLLHPRLARSNLLGNVHDTTFAWQRRSLAAGGNQPTASADLLYGYRHLNFIAWHTRRCCYSQRWLEQLRALDCTYNDATTHRRHYDLLFLGFSRL